MKRSVIQIANSTQLVSLPREWTKRFNIKKGDEIEIEDKGNHLVIHSDKALGIGTKELDITGLPDIIKDILYGLYKIGYEEVKLSYRNPEKTEKIQRVLQNEMIGFEMMEQSRDHCTIRSVAGGLESEFDNMFRRTFLLVKSMAEDILKCMEHGDMAPVNSIKLMEVNTNKYTAFCRRIIHKHGYKDSKKSILMYLVVEELEELADEYKYLCDFFNDTKGKAIKNIPKDILQLFKSLNQYLERVYTTYYSFNFKDVDELFRIRKAFINEVHAKVSNKTPREGRLAHYIVNITQKLANILSYKMEMEL